MNSVSSEPVLVVGAGPTGLTMACELARHGAPVRIVDRLPGILRLARATGVHSRTLEVFHDFGIVDEVVARSAPLHGVKQFAGGEQILHYRSDGLDSPFPFGASLEEWKVEEALERLLGSHGITVERETELVGLEETSNEVRATLRCSDGGTEVVATPWLIGCDGGHSRVRRLKREHFPGEVDPRQYFVADVVLDETHTPDEVYVFLTDHGSLWWFPLPEGRSLLAGDVPEQHESKETPSLEDVQAMLDERVPHAVRASDPRWLSWFHIHYRVSPHYRHDRTFLAGDAAHIHSPIGGQGMNTGIQDAYNLAWKLALVVRGLVPESLLDSYHAERHAVARDVLETTKGLTEKAERYVTLSAQERAGLHRHLVLPDAERMKMLRHAEELDLDYRSSPICRERIEAPVGIAGGPHAGAQARDTRSLVVSNGQVSLFELLRGPRHTLLLMPGLDPGRRTETAGLDALASEVVSSFRDLVQVCLVLPQKADDAATDGGPVTRVYDTEGVLHRRYGASAGRLYLIRPDGYVGFRSEPPERESLFEYLGTMFSGPGS